MVATKMPNTNEIRYPMAAFLQKRSCTGAATHLPRWRQTFTPQGAFKGGIDPC
jgi:hypothetical protein